MNIYCRNLHHHCKITIPYQYAWRAPFVQGPWEVYCPGQVKPVSWRKQSLSSATSSSVAALHSVEDDSTASHSHPLSMCARRTHGEGRTASAAAVATVVWISVTLLSDYWHNGEKLQPLENNQYYRWTDPSPLHHLHMFHRKTTCGYKWTFEEHASRESA